MGIVFKDNANQDEKECVLTGAQLTHSSSQSLVSPPVFRSVFKSEQLFLPDHRFVLESQTRSIVPHKKEIPRCRAKVRRPMSQTPISVGPSNNT